MRLAKLALSLLIVAVTLITIESCQRVQGCTDVTAANYNPNATFDNGTCKYLASFYFDVSAPSAIVTINGQSSATSGYFTGGAPACGASGCANFTLPTGTYNYTATSSSTSWTGSVDVSSNGCNAILLPQNSGNVTFYFDQNGPNATVNIGGQTATVSSNYQTGAPTCGILAAGCANFTLTPGTYNYSASSTLTTWSGSVTITAEGCTEVSLPQSTGAATFWTSSSSFGNITVTVNGGTGVITGFTSVGTPTCGFSGCATFDLLPGTYNYSAASSSGANWSGTVTVTADGCRTIQFT